MSVRSRRIYELFKANDSDKTALLTGERQFTFGELEKRVDKLADNLDVSSTGPDSKIGFLIDNPVEKMIALLATAKTDSLFFNLNTKYPPETIDKILGRTEPGRLLVSSSLRDKLEKTSRQTSGKQLNSSLELFSFPADADDRFPEDAYALLFTSGTTDVPKGVFHSQEDLMFTGEKCFQRWKIKEAEVFLPCMPSFSAATLGCVVVPSLCFGRTIAFPSTRKPAPVVEALNKFEAGFLIGTPTIFTKIISYLDSTNTAVSPNGVRGTVTGAAIPEGFVAKVKEELGFELYPHYGMTELLAVTSTSEGSDFETVGKPLDGVEVEIGEKDRVVVNSPSMASGYLGENRELPTRDGWFLTKDKGKLDPEGNLNVIGRIDNMINRCGNNIFPSEIETSLDRMSEVESSAVFGVEDPTLGERVVAAVRKHDSGPDEEQVRSYLRNKLEKYKVPDEIKFVDRFPKTDSGKIDRRQLKEEL